MKINKVLNEALWQDISESSLFLLDGVIRDMQSVLEDELPSNIERINKGFLYHQDEQAHDLLFNIDKYRNECQEYLNSLTITDGLKNSKKINIDDDRESINNFGESISKLFENASHLKEHVDSKYKNDKDIIALFDDLFETCSTLDKLFDHIIFHLDFYEAITENINKG